MFSAPTDSDRADHPQGTAEGQGSVSSSLPAGRYGPSSSPSRRRGAIVAAGVAVAIGVAWALWAAFGSAAPSVSWSDVGFRVHDDSSVDVTYDVGKDPDATVVCRLEALDKHKGTVGLAQVTVGPSSDRVTRRTDTIRTSAEAVTGTVTGCTLR